MSTLGAIHSRRVPASAAAPTSEHHTEGTSVLLIHEDLARAHTEQRIADAVRAGRVRRLRSAAHAQRKADQAQRLAAQAQSVMTAATA
jgi:hypothetical protein